MTWKEQMVTVPVPDEDRVLEGVWQAGEQGGAVVAPPHPEYGGSLDNPVVHEIAYGLFKQGLASLRFNWQGVGASPGPVTGDPATADRDYAAAVEHVAATTGEPVVACGYSFGSAAALRASLADRRISRLVLVAPPVPMLASFPFDDVGVPVLAIVGSQDAYAPLDRLQLLLEPLGQKRLEVIPGADHFFAQRGLAEIGALVAGEAA